MAMVDERGRFFGRWNLLDLALLVLLLGLIPLGYAAYLLFRDQPPRIVSVSPDHFEQAPEVVVKIVGENLRPYMRVSAGTQQAREFRFKSTEEAEVPFAGMAPGTYDIVLFDQAQERFRLPNALTITPSGLPTTEIIAIGAFGNLDAAGAAKLIAGAELPGAGRILGVGRAVPDRTDVFSGSKLVEVVMKDALRLPAIVRFTCQVRLQGGSPFCVVDDTVIAPTNVLRLTTPLGSTPFQVERVRSVQPVEAIPITVRFSNNPVAAKVRAGDVDLGGTSNELAMLARVERVRADSAGVVDVDLTAQMQRVDRGWLYDSAVLRVGSMLTLRTRDYEASGVVIAMPPAEGQPQR